VHRMKTRIKDVLVMMVAVLLLGASSQAAVCELACGLQMQAAECSMSSAGMSMSMSTAPGATAPGAALSIHQMGAMDHSHCAHGMAMSPQVVVHQVSECHDGGCSHAQIEAFDKAGTSSLSFAVVTWVTVEAVVVDLNLPAHRVGVGERPLFRSAAADPLIVSLRI
jgi:hypothetical protein